MVFFMISNILISIYGIPALVESAVLFLSRYFISK